MGKSLHIISRVLSKETAGTNIRVHKLVDRREDILMTRDVLEGIWTIFLDPSWSARTWSTIIAMDVPWQTVFCLHGKVGGASLAFRVRVIGIEHYRICRRSPAINIHIIIVVGHLEYPWLCCVVEVVAELMSLGDAFFLEVA